MNSLPCGAYGQKWCEMGQGDWILINGRKFYTPFQNQRSSMI